jgi:hypothetical protein
MAVFFSCWVMPAQADRATQAKASMAVWVILING